MKLPSNELVKNTLFWVGVSITIAGAVYRSVNSHDYTGTFITICGVCVSIGSQLIGNKISRIQKAEKAEREAEMAQLRERVESSEAAVNDPILKEIVRERAFDWAEEERERYK